jgi:hypothetical protein
VSVEWPKIIAARAASKFNLNGPVLLANALAAFALNLVSAGGVVLHRLGKHAGQKGGYSSTTCMHAVPYLVHSFSLYV